MKKLFILAIFILVLSIIVGSVYSEELAKEGTGTGTGYYSGSIQMLPMEKERVQINYDVYGIMTSGSKQSIFHNSTQHVLGAMHVFKGAIEDSGFIASTLTSGDKVFMTYKASGKMGKPPIVKGVTTIVGGTGKLKGIQGGGEFTRYSLQPPAKGAAASFSVSKIHWEIVEPTK